MGDFISGVLRTLAGLPPLLTYLAIGLGAALENVFPVVPADTFVLFGAFLTSSGRADPWLVFLATWVCNVGGALGVYHFAYRYGNAFFTHGIGRWFLHPRQLEQIGRFYARWGTSAIFLSRFLPGLRAMVERRGVSSIHLSITDEKAMACAFVVLEGVIQK